MRSIDLSKLLLLTSLIVTPTNVLANSANTKTETIIAATEVAKDYSIDPEHSKISFEVAHLVISSVSGEFKKFKGTFKFNPDDFSQTKLDASAEINSIDTSVRKRDDHLKSPDFFDAKKFPVMTFKSTEAKKTGDKTFYLTGDMTIKGKTKPVTFKVTYNGQINDNTKVLQAFKAVAEINRKDFGVNFQTFVEAGPVVGDTVTIKIACEGTRKP